MDNHIGRRLNGKVTSYNGSYGFIDVDGDNVYLHRNNLKDNAYLCKGDIVSFKLRASCRQKDKKEAYDASLVKFGDYRENYNQTVRLDSDEVKAGLVKWFDKEKGFGVIITLDHKEYFWRESSFMSAAAQTGDAIIFIGDIAKGKKTARKCRFPRYLEDWLYFSKLDDSDSEIVINAYCKIDPYVYGGMGHKDIAYNLKAQANHKILQKGNIRLFKDSVILSDIILYYASRNGYMHMPLTAFRPIFSDCDFNKLCINVFNVIKNKQEERGVKYLFDFIFVDKLVQFSSLCIEDKKSIIDSQIGGRLISKDARFNYGNAKPEIASFKYMLLKEISSAIKEDAEMLSYLYQQVLPLLTDETMLLLFFDNETDSYIDKSSISDVALSKFLLSLGLRKQCSKWYINVPRYGIDLCGKFSIKGLGVNAAIKGAISKDSNNFDVLKQFLISDLFNEEFKKELIAIILENSSLLSVNLILNEELTSSYAITGLGLSKKALDKVKFAKNESFINKLNSMADKFSPDQYIQLLDSGLLAVPDFDYVFKLTRGLPVNYLLTAFSALYRDNPTQYWEFFRNIYELLSKKERMYLWMNDLNDCYNYIDLIQTVHCLAPEERKSFNKKIKEYAKSERFNSFLDQIPEAETEDKDGDEITYRCKWRNLYYRNGEVIVFLNKTNALCAYDWAPAREEWNWLTNEYFNRKRICDIIVVVNHRHVVDIKGLDEIEERIVIADIQKNGSLNHKSKIAKEQLVRIIHNVAARNRCIDFLSRQDSQFDAIDIQELVSTKYGEISRDISFMFIFPNNGNAYIIWESVEYEKSKATYIFRCDLDSALPHADNIKKYIENNCHVRSNLTSSSGFEEVRAVLKFYGKVMHDSQKYEVWEKRMKEQLPFLK